MRIRMTLNPAQLSEWYDLPILLAVYREGSVSGAARRLGVDQSTISRRLAALEDQVGGALFVRDRTGTWPTALARQLIPAAERAELAVRDAMLTAAAATSSATGTVRIALPDALADLVVAPALGGLCRAHPGLRIELDTRIDVVDIARLEADIALRFVRPDRGDVLVRRVGTTRCGVWGTAEYLTSRTGMRLQELDWVGWDASLAHLPESRWLAANVGVAPSISCTRATTVVQAVRAGAGVAMLPERFAARFPELVELPSTARDLVYEVWLVRPRALRDAPGVDVVATWLAGLIEGMGPSTDASV
jgi:DNA-binding transcriptional LysR family regulator